ncbi:hypothetical protein GCWU000342_00404 [Shuttleworthella satelles DSM 14600]|uniref:Uncharacterized protein n=1 Tax=Shuttleworthella satelles DSM 14600 TaxID=626523 RepID=C4G8V7_9FIRM|nr:hypothetical protein GCWU000342_00404 [Shuttleworthia satelles DSM 14600]
MHHLLIFCYHNMTQNIHISILFLGSPSIDLTPGDHPCPLYFQTSQSAAKIRLSSTS